jgi:hypothetical protein
LAQLLAGGGIRADLAHNAAHQPFRHDNLT